MRWLLAGLVVVGCAPDEAPKPPPEPAFEIAKPAEFVRELAASEDAANALKKSAGAGICRALQSRDLDALELHLAADFQGRPPGVGEDQGAQGVTLVEYRAEPKPVDRATWAKAMQDHAAPYAAITRCRLKPFEFRLEPDGKHAWAQLHFDLDGRGAEGHALADRGDLMVRAVRKGKSWQLTQAAYVWLRRVTVARKGLVDVSVAAGVSLNRDPRSAELLVETVDDKQIETIGGVAVLDVDQDGFPDFAAWNNRQMLHLFRNDGAGGFQRQPDLIPPRHVGLSVRFVDLDGDGVDELISSAAICSGDLSSLALYRQVEGRYQLVPGALPVPLRCLAADGINLQHLAVADIDRDGDLDLFVSGYGAPRATGRFNRFHSDDGQENFLFVNQGGLKFEEGAAARGLTGRRATYVSGFFDYDGDGDEDLYVVNDFAPNELFLNDGQGRFTRTEDPVLTENGQSMGLTFGDFDGDLDLDVYVSNMYSSAGHRIAPLVAHELKPETAKTLHRLAEGNSLYLQDGPGKFSEGAHPLGIAHAGWAWGQAWYDHDNDGYRDLYVVNGMTSHSEIREHDF